MHVYKAALDVYYYNNIARAACFLFKHWTDIKPTRTFIIEIESVAEYEPGAFYKRELPPILEVLKQVDLGALEILLIDGYVSLNNNSLGLGEHLFSAVNEAVPVIGIAKSRFYKNNEKVVELIRGHSKRPLYITAIGIDVASAASYVKSMAGPYRVPHLLKLLDHQTKKIK